MPSKASTPRACGFGALGATTCGDRLPSSPRACFYFSLTRKGWHRSTIFDATEPTRPRHAHTCPP